MSLQQFNFQNHEIRTIFQDGAPWFVLGDIARVLDIKNPRDSVELRAKQKGVGKIDTPGGPQTVAIISEGGLFRLALRSNSPLAEPFQGWVEDELLPTLRKTGTYQIGQPQGIASTISMTLPDGTRIEGLPVSAVSHLIPSLPAPDEKKNFQPSLELKQKQLPGQKVFDYEGSVKGMRSGWYSLAELSSRIGCKPKTLNTMILKRKLPRTWGSRWSKGQWWVYLP
jgi:hypothetical protein